MDTMLWRSAVYGAVVGFLLLFASAILCVPIYRVLRDDRGMFAPLKRAWDTLFATRSYHRLMVALILDVFTLTLWGAWMDNDRLGVPVVALLLSPVAAAATVYWARLLGRGHGALSE